MAGVNYIIDYDDGLLEQRLNGLLQRADSLEPVLREIGEAMLLNTEQRFRDQVDPDGKAWEPLKPSYRQRKKRNRNRILYLNGYLAQLNYRVNGNDLAWGTGMIYGATHQFGDDGRNIPARPWLGISRSDRLEINDLIQDYLSDIGLND